MPTYDFECSKCGHKFERFQKMSDPPVIKCTKCGKKAERLIGGGSGIIFKGTGFYDTDYKKKSKSKTDTPCPSPKGDSCKGCPRSNDKK